MQLQLFSCSSKKRRNSPYIKALCLILLVCLSLTFVYNLQVIPALFPFAESQITTEVTKTMQSIIRRCVSSEEYRFVNITYNQNGDIASLETVSKTVALVNSAITESAAEELTQNNILNVKIPIGNLFGGAFFVGKGPNINFKIRFSPKIVCRIENEFYESGINQTLHRIVAKIDVKAYALLPFSTEEITINTEYCIAETVIVGKVPEAYTKINRLNDELEESDIDDIFDFGASLE